MVRVVWFKRDIRVLDHRPLHEASAAGTPTIYLYCFEPRIISAPEWDPSHSVFLAQCLEELDQRLRRLGARLTCRVGDMPAVLKELQAQLAPPLRITHLTAHEETGLLRTYERDRAVHAYCREHAIAFDEYPQSGVVRRLRSRDGWGSTWNRRMREGVCPVPDQLPCIRSVIPTWEFGSIPSRQKLRQGPSQRSGAQPGGTSFAEELLDSFLEERARGYVRGMSSPLSAAHDCSRLSPHLALGTISSRVVYQRLQGAVSEHRETGERGMVRPLNAFGSRLRWRCHFTQKLESEPEIEVRNMNRAFDGMRVEDQSQWTQRDHELFSAFCSGQTGFPFIDACLRCLLKTGWINFRMRSMLVSFACNHLWLHWKPVGTFLARCFLDFEPGIHYPQLQMQAAVTGINTVRIYSPIKQSHDQDPDGVFIREWVPELRALEAREIHEPSAIEHASRGGLFDHVRIAPEYPSPIVDHQDAYRRAQQAIFAVRSHAETRSESRRVYELHGSRSRRRSRG